MSIFFTPIIKSKSPIIFDRFFGPQNVTITGRLPDTINNGSTWTDIAFKNPPTADQGRTVDNKLALLLNNNGNGIDAKFSNVIIEIDWYLAVGVVNRNSVVFRYVNFNECWLFNIREENSDWQLLYNVDPGGTTTVDSGAYSWVEGEMYKIKVELSGDDIYCYIDNNLVSSYNSSLYNTATIHGVIRNNGSDNTRIDNFKIYRN